MDYRPPNMANVKWTMDYSPWYQLPIWPTKSGPWIIVHRIDLQVWPTKTGPWTVHGIDCPVWPTKSGPWTIYRPLSMANIKWTMDYSPWYRL